MENVFKVHTNVLFSTLVAILLVFPSAGNAAVNITVNPDEGGNSLRFGRVDLTTTNDKEVSIRLTSTDGRQYQVFQRLNEPLINEKGQTLERSTLISSSVTGSNAFGSLYLQGLDPLGFVDQMVYTSDMSGQNDSIKVVYRVDTSAIREPGNYYGSIVFTIRPVGGGNQTDVILNIYLETANEMKITAKSSTGMNSLTLRTDGVGRQTGSYEIAFKDSYNNPVKINQDVIEPLRDDAGQELDLKDILFSSSGECDELAPPSPTEVPQRAFLVCSDKNGNGFVNVNFELSPELAEERSGIYSGKLRYTVESQRATETFDLDLRVEVTPIFKLVIESPTGGMGFNRLIATDPPQFREMLISIKTNLGKPYIVTQNMSIPLTNESGSAMATDYFTFRQELLDQQPGKVFNPKFLPVPIKENPIFYSDPKGSPAQFRVIYRLRPFEGMIPGNYTTSLTYSLGEI